MTGRAIGAGHARRARSPTSAPAPTPGLRLILREWERIGCIGFGGPPAHIALLRELCVTRRGWLDDREFEDAITATNLLPGPASTQLAIYCAWRLRGIAGALAGGVGFIVPGLGLILALAALFLAASPPEWVLGAGAGSGAGVAAVALHAAAGQATASWRRRGRAAALGPLRARRRQLRRDRRRVARARPARLRRHRGRPPTRAIRRRRHGCQCLAAARGAAGATSGGLLALAWVAFKVGALSYGGGFVIIPLMQHDPVDSYHSVTDAQFLNAVALGQVTPRPGRADRRCCRLCRRGHRRRAARRRRCVRPSFSFILIGAERFDRLRANQSVRGFLDGAGPAAIGARDAE